MAKPVTNPPTWATDGGARVEPSSGEKATGYVAGERPSPRKMNFLLGLFGDWLFHLKDFTTDDDFSYPTPKARTRIIGASCGHSEIDSGGRVDWQIIVASDRIQLACTGQANGIVYFPISEHVPRGATITAIEARVKPIAAELTGDRIELAYFVEDPTVSASHLGPVGTVEDDGTTDEQEIEITGLSLLNSGLLHYSARVRGSDTTGAAVYWLRVSFTQPGPSF